MAVARRILGEVGCLDRLGVLTMGRSNFSSRAGARRKPWALISSPGPRLTRPRLSWQSSRTRTNIGRLLRLEVLEDRSLLSATADVSPLGPQVLAIDPTSYDESRILVRFRSDPALDSAPALSNTQLGRELSLVPGLHEVELGAGVSVEDALAAYKSDPNVLYAEPDYRVGLQLTPNDPSFSSLWGLHNAGQTGGLADADIDAPEAWDVTTGSGSIVAVIDTGVDYTHPDLAANIWTNSDEIAGNGIDDDGNGYIDDIHGYDFVNGDGDPRDDHFHGTHVAGTIGAVGNNGIGVAGVNWSVQIMALKFLDAGGGGNLSDAIAALNYAVANGAKISNNSWGGGGHSAALENAIIAAANAGHIFVAAAGNDGSNNDFAPFYPASYDVPNVVSVAASNHLDEFAYFSNYGQNTVHLAAPGEAILSTFPTYQTGAMQGSGFSTYYETISGTSMATPHVSGVLALVAGQHPEWSSDQVIFQVLATVDVVPSLSQTITGGRLNAAAAVGNPAPDLTGPRVVSTNPSGTVTGAVSSMRVTFNEAINAATLTPADLVSFTGPAGAIDLSQATVTPVSNTNGRQFEIAFPTQSVLGAYSLLLGPDIFDQADPANAMDQDADGINGEPSDDRYTARFTISEALVFHSDDVPAPIYEYTATISYLTIDQDVLIGDLDLQLDITHTYDGDLAIYLIAPTGDYASLAQFRGGSGDNFSGTIFDDEAAVHIADGVAPFPGAYQPETPLSWFDGLNARGTWSLWVEDWGFFDEGFINAWSLTIQSGSGEPPPPGDNQPPNAYDDYAATDEDTPVIVNVLSNDDDPDGDPLAVTAIIGSYGGVAAINADNTVTFTPDPNFNYYSGTAWFGYEISDGRGGQSSAYAYLDVYPINDPPVAVDDRFAGYRDEPLYLSPYYSSNPLANDVDVDGDYLWISEVRNPQNGTVTLDPYSGDVVFVPAAGFIGLASFEYVVTDGQDSDVGRVEIDVRSVQYISLTTGGTLTGTDGVSVSFANADILRLVADGAGGYQYRMYFDGSDVGLTTSGEDIDAFDILPDGGILISTVGNYSVPRPGGGSLSGSGHDVLYFTPNSLGNQTSGHWDVWFDGSDVGLTLAAENVDAVTLLADYRLVISTSGNVSVPGVSGVDADLLVFSPYSYGAVTSGTWQMYFDGSDVGLTTTSEDVDGLYIQEDPLDPTGVLPRLYFSTRGTFGVAGVSGENEDAVRFNPTQLGANTAGSYGPGLSLDGSRYGLSSLDIDGMHFGLAPNEYLVASSGLGIRSAGLSNAPGGSFGNPGAAMRELASLALSNLASPLGLAQQVESLFGQSSLEILAPAAVRRGSVSLGGPAAIDRGATELAALNANAVDQIFSGSAAIGQGLDLLQALDLAWERFGV